MAQTQLRIEQLDAMTVQILSAKMPKERLAMAFHAHKLVKNRIRAHLKFEHSDWSEQEIDAEVARRLLWNSRTS
jgi:hypothetical protein